MYNGDRITRLTIVFLYFIQGVTAFFALYMNGHTYYIDNIIALALWMCIILLLVFLKYTTENQIRLVYFIELLFGTFFGLYLAISYERPYLFVFFSFCIWLANIPGLRKYVFDILTIFNTIATLLLVFLFHKFDIVDGAACISSYFVFDWISHIYANKTSKMIQMIKAQNQSYDELVELVEEKFFAEKGANTAKSAFLANMSHEIRTPINAILGINTMTLRESHEDNIKEYAKDIDRAGQTLLSLINDILDISKVESGKMDIIAVEYNLSTLLTDVINMIYLKANMKNLEVRLEADKNLPSRLFGDDVRIRQIIINLMNNAVKYTEKGSVTLKVSGERNGENEVLHYSVIDTGIGIRDEDREKLFEKFERLDTVRNRNVEGTGLGINITTRLLELMGSELVVNSKYGEGSEFSFTIVQKIANSEPIGDITTNSDSEDKKEDEVRFIAPDANVLMVDDNGMNRKVFVKLLQRTKINVDDAADGPAALKLISEKQYDIIFLDHMMPEMDGIEVLNRMKENSISPNINTPVIALTANAISGSKEFYLSQGFDNYLSKPINSVELEKMIYSLLPLEKKELFSREK